MVGLRESIASDSLRDDLLTVADRVTRVTGREPVAVDLTHRRLGIPVIRIVTPGLRFNARTTFKPGRSTLPTTRSLDGNWEAA